MENIAHGAVVENHDFTQIRFDLCQIFDICAIAKRAVLAVVSATKVFAFAFDPVNDRVCVLLHGCSEDYQIVPFADLIMVELVTGKVKIPEVGPHLAQEIMAVWALMHIVQYRNLRAKKHAVPSDGTLKLDFDHMTSAHSPTFGHTVDQRLIQVDDEGLLRRVGVIGHDVGWLAARY